MTDYELRTAVGTKKLTTPELDLAIAEAERLAKQFPGLVVVKVVRPDPIELTVWPERRAA